jgi:hypothetical protein
MACISYHARETAHPKVKNTRDDTHNQWFAGLKSPRLGSAWRSGSGTYKLVGHSLLGLGSGFRDQKKSSLLYNGLKWPPFSSNIEQLHSLECSAQLFSKNEFLALHETVKTNDAMTGRYCSLSHRPESQTGNRFPFHSTETAANQHG